MHTTRNTLINVGISVGYNPTVLPSDFASVNVADCIPSDLSDGKADGNFKISFVEQSPPFICKPDTAFSPLTPSSNPNAAPIQTATTHTLNVLRRRRRQGRTTKLFSGEAVRRCLRLLPGKSPPPPRRGRRTLPPCLPSTPSQQPYPPPCNWSRHRHRRPRRETSPEASTGPAASHIGETG
ncbi:hypothetical protein PIB30_077476 [Stylosanthes scabra]|uniref:Uncharacterized protein n=1 Tax=Stylosanthes scabra TaxID=79078 RepID=A0ABU6ZP81_9FABA|nr:hypothetical protein [Stylosanthes scabra]